MKLTLTLKLKQGYKLATFRENIPGKKMKWYKKTSCMHLSLVLGTES